MREERKEGKKNGREGRWEEGKKIWKAIYLIFNIFKRILPNVLYIRCWLHELTRLSFLLCWLLPWSLVFSPHVCRVVTSSCWASELYICAVYFGFRILQALASENLSPLLCKTLNVIQNYLCSTTPGSCRLQNCGAGESQS